MKSSLVRLISISAILILVITVIQIIYTLSPANNILENELNIKPVPTNLQKKLILDIANRANEYR